MIDPITALAGIQSAVALIKKVSKTVDDVGSLGPVLGKYFDAKNNATKAAHQVKSNDKKSNMSIAIEIEMALHQAEEFEKQLQLLFMQSGKIDVWNKIKARSFALDIDAAHQARKEKEEKKRKKQELQESMEIVIGTIIILVILVGLGWTFFELLEFCQKNECGK
jgi:hypothetical protein